MLEQLSCDFDAVHLGSPVPSVDSIRLFRVRHYVES